MRKRLHSLFDRMILETAWKRKGFATLFFLLCAQNVFGQSITNYTFSATSGSYTALTGATTATRSVGTNDEGAYNSIPIGFTFIYMGAQYTTISASTNGWLTFGQSISSYAATNALTTGGTRPLIAPL